MGYTHYWNHSNIDQDKWDNEFIPNVKKVIGHPDCPYLAGERGFDDPVADSEGVFLNGPDENGHESFILRPGKTDSDFCKTARKPYDSAVVAILALASAIFPGFEWSSDGSADGHAEGLELLKIATGLDGSPAS